MWCYDTVQCGVERRKKTTLLRSWSWIRIDIDVEWRNVEKVGKGAGCTVQAVDDCGMSNALTAYSKYCRYLEFQVLGT